MNTTLLDRHAPSSTFAADVEAGLLREGQKELPPKYFYDAVGSALFEAWMPKSWGMGAGT